MTWWQGLTRQMKIGSVAAAFAALSGVLTLVGQIEAGERYWPATRGHVADKVQHSEGRVVHRLIDLQMNQERSEKRRLEGVVADKTTLLEESKDASIALKRNLTDQINDYFRQIKDTEGRLEQLERERNGRRP